MPREAISDTSESRSSTKIVWRACPARSACSRTKIERPSARSQNGLSLVREEGRLGAEQALVPWSRRRVVADADPGVEVECHGPIVALCGACWCGISWKEAGQPVAASRGDFYFTLEGIYGFLGCRLLPQVTRGEAQLRPGSRGSRVRTSLTALAGNRNRALCRNSLLSRSSGRSTAVATVPKEVPVQRGLGRSAAPHERGVTACV